MKIEILLSVRIGQAKRGRGKSRKVGFDLSGIPAVTSQALDFEALCRETKTSLHFIRVRYPSFVNEFVKSDSCPLSSLVSPLRLRVFARALFWLSAARGCAFTRSSEQPQNAEECGSIHHGPLTRPSATLSHWERVWGLDICGTEKRGWPSPVASRHPLPQGEGEQGVGAVVKQTFRALPLPRCHETSACSLEVRALMRGSLPRPWGEGGRRPGEGQPTRIAPQNVQTPDPLPLGEGLGVRGRRLNKFDRSLSFFATN